MEPPLTSLEKHFIERKFIADEAARARKRKFLRWILTFGFACGFGAGIAKGLFYHVRLEHVVFKTVTFCLWVVSLGLYADWFAGSLQGALKGLKDEGRQIKAVVLFLAPTLGWITGLSVLVLLKMIRAALG